MSNERDGGSSSSSGDRGEHVLLQEGKLSSGAVPTLSDMTLSLHPSEASRVFRHLSVSPKIF